MRIWVGLLLAGHQQTVSAQSGSGSGEELEGATNGDFSSFEIDGTLYFETDALQSSSYAALETLCDDLETEFCSNYPLVSFCNIDHCASSCTKESTDNTIDNNDGDGDSVWDVNDEVDFNHEDLYSCFNVEGLTLHGEEGDIVDLATGQNAAASTAAGLLQQALYRILKRGPDGIDGTADDGDSGTETGDLAVNNVENNPITGFDCNVDNGQCSHICHGTGVDTTCSCPTCWHLAEDLRTCLVEDDKISLQCTADSMIADVDSCVVEGASEFHLGMDNNCNQDSGHVTLDNGTIHFDVRLDECSTFAEAKLDQNQICFTQTLQSVMGGVTGDVFGGLVSIQPRVELEFKCTYATNYTDVGQNITVSPDIVEKSLDGEGSFVFNIQTYTDSTFSTQHDITAADPFMVGSTLNFGVCSPAPLDNVRFTVPTCTVHASNGVDSYDIMMDHCLDMFVSTTRYNPEVDIFGLATNLPVETCAHFSYTVFEFVSNEEDEDELRLSCKVQVCNYNEDKPSDMTPCVEDNCGGRRRRSAALEPLTSYYNVAITFPITKK